MSNAKDNTKETQTMEEGQIIDLGEVIDKLQTQTMKDTKSYIVSLKEIIKRIKESESKLEDRVDYAKALNLCFNGGIISLNGWKAWVGDIDNVAELSLEELKQVYPKISSLIITLLEIDIEITEKKLIETAVKVSKSKTRRKEDNGKKTTYVA